jgi:hypothetical protein
LPPPITPQSLPHTVLMLPTIKHLIFRIKH